MSNDKSNPAWWNAKYSFLRMTNNSVYPWLTEEDSWIDSIPIGWRDEFFEDMCNELSNILGKYINYFVIDQLKEKYNEIVLYWSWKDDEYTDEDLDNMKKLFIAINNIIDRYAKISYHTCTNCGAPATKWTKSGWITSFCNKCYERYWEDE